MSCSKMRQKEVWDMQIFSTKPFKGQSTAPLPTICTNISWPFETTGVDCAVPFLYRAGKNKAEKAYIIIFTCAVMRGIRFEVTQTQGADEFKAKLNAFITRKTRPKLLVSDNAQVFNTTANWIKNSRKSESLQDYLAKQDISWRFNLPKSPWWGPMYERLIKDLKRALYKTVGKLLLSFEHFGTIVMDIERHMNNRPLTYVEGDNKESQVLTQRWKKEYLHSLLGVHHITKTNSYIPKPGDIVLVSGEEKNRGEWKKGKVINLIKEKKKSLEE